MCLKVRSVAQRSAKNHDRGFTLIELLVSISIVAMLIAIVAPAVFQARAVARRAACQSNLRQWVLAVQMFADTHHGQLPFRGQGIQPTTRLDDPRDWINALPPMMDKPTYAEMAAARQKPAARDASIWICPDAKRIDVNVVAHADPTTFFVYAMNMALSTPYLGRPDRIDRIGSLQLMVFMADSLGPYCSTIPSKYDYTPIARHAGKTVNIAFMDGRVEAFAGDDVGCRIGDPKRPDIVWYPPNEPNGGWPGPPR